MDGFGASQPLGQVSHAWCQETHGDDHIAAFAAIGRDEHVQEVARIRASLSRGRGRRAPGRL